MDENTKLKAEVRKYQDRPVNPQLNSLEEVRASAKDAYRVFRVGKVLELGRLEKGAMLLCFEKVYLVVRQEWPNAAEVTCVEVGTGSIQHLQREIMVNRLVPVD